MRAECINAHTPPGFADYRDTSGAIVDGTWRLDAVVMNDHNYVARNHPANVTSVRDAFTDYFNGAGSVDWQNRYINRTR